MMSLPPPHKILLSMHIDEYVQTNMQLFCMQMNKTGQFELQCYLASE